MPKENIWGPAPSRFQIARSKLWNWKEMRIRRYRVVLYGNSYSRVLGFSLTERGAKKMWYPLRFRCGYDKRLSNGDWVAIEYPAAEDSPRISPEEYHLRSM